MEDIIRKYPVKEYYFDNRQTNSDVKKYGAIIQNIENYNKWKAGINFKTNRPIKIGGRTHKEIGRDEFYIGKQLFTYLYDKVGADPEAYIAETDRIKKEIYDHNSQLDSIINQINSLEKWDNYVELSGKKYGISRIYDGIHRENDCFGVMKFNSSERCRCHLCENWGGCREQEIKYYKCEKCGYISSEKIDTSRDYRGK